ncbi:hypothetical protein [Spirosoma endbachense]|uniref:Uncharacterized protein n=1 Tax=Spirosoma endbachense TaxID=2666025 RepID=A0A6P1W2R0_9BACT|nr:hypothetical protein [Spirosoma endbachense]QHV97976.1 hypothetical protein GJR95_24500 [Spirosoma endbachense]
MNLMTALNPRTVNFLTSVGKGNLLPMKAEMTIPATLDWVIRQRMFQVWQLQGTGAYESETSREDLYKLYQTFGPFERSWDYKMTLYGFEWNLLYSFLLEQDQWFFVWASDVIPPYLQANVKKELATFIQDLETVCMVVDVWASRPIIGNG